jgi:hypothetical protein
VIEVRYGQHNPEARNRMRLAIDRLENCAVENLLLGCQQCHNRLRHG